MATEFACVPCANHGTRHFMSYALAQPSSFGIMTLVQVGKLRRREAKDLRVNRDLTLGWLGLGGHRVLHHGYVQVSKGSDC